MVAIRKVLNSAIELAWTTLVAVLSEFPSHGWRQPKLPWRRSDRRLLNSDGSSGKSVRWAARKYRLLALSESTDLADRFSARNGYRFVVEKIKCPKTVGQGLRFHVYNIILICFYHALSALIFLFFQTQGSALRLL